MLGLSTTVSRLFSKKNTFLLFHEQFLTFLEIGLHFSRLVFSATDLALPKVSATLRLNLYCSTRCSFETGAVLEISVPWSLSSAVLPKYR